MTWILFYTLAIVNGHSIRCTLAKGLNPLPKLICFSSQAQALVQPEEDSRHKWALDLKITSEMTYSDKIKVGNIQQIVSFQCTRDRKCLQ